MENMIDTPSPAEEKSKRTAMALIKRHDSKKSKRVNWDQNWQDITNFVMPDKNDVFEKFNRAKGDRKHHKLYEGSAIHFNEILSNTLHSMMTNPSQIWFELNAQNKKINEVPAVRKWLQELAEKMTQILNGTNFQAQVHEVYLDLGSLGTGVLGIYEDDDNVMRFDSKPIYHFYIRENSKGIVDEISYIDEMTVENAFEKFGEESFGAEAEQLMKDPGKLTKIMNFILPRAVEDRLGFGSKSHPFASYHIYCDKPMVLQEKGYKEFPFVVPRWMKLSDEMYGRSPSMKALPDIKMLNAMMKTTIRGAQKIVDPILLVPDDGLLGRVNAIPGGQIPYRAGTDDRVSALQTGGDPGLGVEIIKDVRGRVKEHYFVDQFQLREGPQMTATEVNARVEMQLRLLGPILGRLHFEFLKPMVSRMLNIMQRKNLLPENPPPELTENDLDLEVFFTSQIAKAQRAGEANGLLEFLQSVQPIIDFDPEAADVIDIDATIRKIAILKGVSEDIFRPLEDIEKLREARNVEKENAMKAQEEMQGAEVLNKAAGPVQDLGLIQGG
tara:strand:- start:1582 stop:3243 length:1662 start_codon:yes stop_codon:yes gene_type:complete